jgi:hypothetical protein
MGFTVEHHQRRQAWFADQLQLLQIGRLTRKSEMRANDRAAFLGSHSTYAITVDTYAHIAVAQQREPVERLGEACPW